MVSQRATWKPEGTKAQEKSRDEGDWEREEMAGEKNELWER